MTSVQDVLAGVDFDQLAQQVGGDPAEVRAAAEAAVPALLGGMQANANDPAGAASLAEAVGQHDPALASGPVDVTSVDTGDGEAITRHVFGDARDDVVNQLGGLGGGNSALVRKLLPILAPIVLSYLAKQMGSRAGSGTAGGAAGGVLGTVLEEVLKGASQGSATRGTSAGSILGNVLGGLLGRGRR